MDRPFQLALIAAVAENGVIGRDGDLPWHLPDDMRFFKRKTRGSVVIMGRKTYESLGGALPERRNIIVTRQGELAGDVEVASSLEDALAMAAQTTPAGGEVFVAGGQRMYREALDQADRLYITRVHASPTGDTQFPDFDEQQWRVVEREEHPADARHAHAFTFMTYERG